jgi:hypothetical protein
VFGLDEETQGDLTGLTSADGSILIQDPGGPVPDLQVRRKFGAMALGPGAMGPLAIATWIQIPLPINAPAERVGQVANTLVILPGEGDTYLMGYGVAFDYVNALGLSVIRFAMTLGGSPAAAGVIIAGTRAIVGLDGTERVATVSRTSLLTLSPGQFMGLWLFVDTGAAPMDATSLDVDMWTVKAG